MPFPKVERVKYSKSPLDNVVCQLRFPPVLEIDFELPYKFQNAIRKQFPIYEEKVEMHQEINIGLNGAMMDSMPRLSSNKNHEFISEDGLWRINLTRTFMSISTTKYDTWEDMLERLKNPLKALKEIYTPAFISRVGLRYVDIFCRTNMGLENVSWSELIQPYFLGMLSSGVASSINEMNNVYEICCDDRASMIRIETGLVRKMDNNEQCFMMDSDVYTTEKVLLENVENKLNYLHDRASRLVRYAITDKMHNGMEPEKL